MTDILGFELKPTAMRLCELIAAAGKTDDTKPLLEAFDVAETRLEDIRAEMRALLDEAELVVLLMSGGRCLDDHVWRSTIRAVLADMDDSDDHEFGSFRTIDRAVYTMQLAADLYVDQVRALAAARSHPASDAANGHLPPLINAAQA